jgi:hypothetical protein
MAQPRLGRVWAEACRADTARPTHRAVPVSRRAAHTGQARPNTTWAVPGRPEGMMAYRAFPQNKSNFPPSSWTVTYLAKKVYIFSLFFGL